MVIDPQEEDEDDSKAADNNQETPFVKIEGALANLN